MRSDRRLPGTFGRLHVDHVAGLVAEQRRAERRRRRDGAGAADGADLDGHRLAAFLGDVDDGADADRVRNASSTISALSSRARSVRMRASSRPCSFFAAWYSKFSERSPNSRAFLIAATTSVRRGPSSSASSSRSASACFAVSCLYHFERPPAGATCKRAAAAPSSCRTPGTSRCVPGDARRG